MRKNRVFFPQDALDQWISEERVELVSTELVLKSENRRYRVVEAARVLAEVTGGDDTFELVGKVKSIVFLTELGAELLGSSMVLGDLAYEVVPGFLGTPIGSFAQHRAGSVPPPRAPLVTNDEEMLARFLVQNLE
jgi:hypothetical protein